jgi:hypothetical protein
VVIHGKRCRGEKRAATSRQREASGVASIIDAIDEI